jgi:hypothetical protein
MKKKILTFCLFAIGFIPALAQSGSPSTNAVTAKSQAEKFRIELKKQKSSRGTINSKYIIYKFDNKTLIKPDLQSLRPDGFYQVVVDSINLNLYKVTVNTKDSTIAVPLQMPTFTGLDLEGITKAIAGISPTTTTVNKTVTVDAMVTKGNKGMGSKSYIVSQRGKVYPKMEEVKKQLNLFKSDLEKVKTKIDELYFKVYQTQLNELKISPDLAGSFEYNAALKEISDIRASIPVFQERVNTSLKDYTDFTEVPEHKKEISDHIDLIAADKAITESFTKILTACADASTAVSADKGKELLTGLIVSENNAGMMYVSLPIQFKKDQATMTLTIEPRKPEYGLGTFKEQLVFPLQKSFYAGVGISFYGTSLHDEAYSVIGTPLNDSVNTYKPKAENFTKAEVGIAALLRLGFKHGADGAFGYHLSLGPGVTLGSKIKPRLLIGPGLSFGRKHMLTIDAGAIFGYVDRKSTTVELDQSYQIKPDNITVSKLNAGAYFAIGYLFRL